MKIIPFKDLEKLIIKIENQKVLVDSDVAKLYGVETRDVNQAVTNNPDKFPKGYIYELSDIAKMELVENFHRFKKLKHSTVNPKAFTEKALYMLATILKSKQATQATLLIIETFSRIRELSNSIKKLSATKDETEQKSLMQKGGEMIAEILGDDLTTTDSETSFELNFAVLKFKHTVNKKKK
jgi:hypothetical protein